jgi:hypothetical protein
MTKRENVELLVINLPASLMRWFGISAQREGLTSDEAMTRLLEGLPGLENGGIKSLEEPPREPRCSSRFHVSRAAVQALNETSCLSGLDRAKICRRVMYGILVTHQIRFLGDADSDQFLLRRTQLEFDFANES